MIEQQRADAAAGMVGIDEKGADFRRLGFGIEDGCIAPRAGVAAEQRRAEAPAAAAQESALSLLDHEVGLVGQQLAVDAECAAQRALDLRAAGTP